jgi:ATP-dependent Clp protease, protease subunit
MPEIELVSVETPKYLENLQLPDPNLLSYYKNASNRTYWIEGEVCADILEIGKAIIDCNREDRDLPIDQIKPVRICLFTPGGEIEPTFSLINIIEMSRTPVYTYNMGIAMSCGLWLLLAGHKRFCTKGSRSMLHSGTGGASGTFEQVESATKDYKKLIDYTREYTMRKSLIDAKTLARYKDKDWYFYTDDQLKYGLVDAVISDISELL